MTSSQNDTIFDAESILERITDAFFALDCDWCFTYINREAENLWGRTRNQMLGKNVWAEFPQAVGSVFDQQFHRAMDEQSLVSFEEFYPPLDAWLHVRLYPSSDGLSVFFQDVSDHKTAATERKQHEEALRQSEERYRLLVDGAKDYAMILMDPQARITSWNAGAECIMGWSEDEVLGQPADLFFTPEDCAAGVPAEELGRASAEGKAMDLRWHLKKDGSRFYSDGIMEGLRGDDGHLRGFAKVLRDATARHNTDKTLAERTRLLMLPADVGIALTTRDTLADMLQGCVEAMVEHLDAAFARVWVLDKDEDVLVLHASAGQYTHLDGPHGRVPVGQFKIGLIAQERQPHLTNAVIGDPRVGDQEWARREGMVAFAGYPLVIDDRLIGVTALFSRHTLSEVSLQALGSVADQIAVGIDRRRAEEAMQEANQRTTSILESITDAFFAVDAAWRFTNLNAQGEKLLSRTRHELLGRNIWAEFPAAVGTAFDHQYHRAVGQQVAVTFEEYYPPPLDTWFEVRAYPASDGLSVYFHDISERKAQEAERERLAERERNIAQQLQVALTPAIPEHIPGMALAKYYEAALGEAGVGGDFYDVFAVDKGCTALVVGDLAGKGLAAASQVATIRNMLRYALYRAHTISAALTSLNMLLAEQSLLTGFATLFVGAYDSGAGTLTYVNCGQEPALVRRVSGAIELLMPSGPIMGSIEGATFDENTVRLGPGDAVAIFSDGLTEVGRSRAEMIGIEGITDLLARAAPPADADTAKSVAEHLALRLIAGVDAAAEGGVMRDDVCLLVGVVE